jgi:hypothetical protein
MYHTKKKRNKLSIRHAAICICVHDGVGGWQAVGDGGGSRLFLQNKISSPE